MRLPIDVHRDAIAESAHRSRVTIIRADTGSGKTTRVPLFIRDFHHRKNLQASAALQRTAQQTEEAAYPGVLSLYSQYWMYKY